MRIAFLAFSAPPHNAVGNQIAEKARFFQDRGAEVRVFVQDARRVHADLQSCTIAASNPCAAGPIWDYLASSDLVFAVYSQGFDLLSYLPLLNDAGVKIVFDYLGVTPPELAHPAHREVLRNSQRSRGHVWCADAVLTMSDASRRELLNATRFPDAHTVTLPLPVDTARLCAGPRDSYLHQCLKIDGRIVLFVGRLAVNKRVPVLIQALSKLGQPDTHVVHLGDSGDIYSAEREECRSLVDDLGLADRVHFMGQIDDADLPRAYRSADVLVVPSLHEGFCVPVIEAFASGVPVIAARATALPEVIGSAGLTFAPDDPGDLARQLNRVFTEQGAPRAIAHRRRIAIVSFRFGPEIVGGAESSLRTLAKSALEHGIEVEVFTTCTRSESHWQNELPAGTVTLDGLTVHRFPIDPHDAGRHGKIVSEIIDAKGQVGPEIEERYLRSSIHSSALIDALRKRESEFDAIVTGPYLFGLTHDIASAFPRKSLIVPCFHDEPTARLSVWPKVYGECAGVLYHSDAEQWFAECRLGVNHPNSHWLGAVVPTAPAKERKFPRLKSPYLVYCGRYSQQKNVTTIVEWGRRYCEEFPGQVELVFMGHGEVKLPKEPWLHDLGRVDEETKRAVLAGARALVQLSTQESLSLVVLEAWAQRTPVIVHRDSAVLVQQVNRSSGGVAVSGYRGFAQAIDDLLKNEPDRRRRGVAGHAYVTANYASASTYVERFVRALDQMQMPIRDQMRQRGLARAVEYSRACWQKQFAEFVDGVLTSPRRKCHETLAIECMKSSLTFDASKRCMLPIRIRNDGSHASLPEGPGRTVICCEVRDNASGEVIVSRFETRLPSLLVPGEPQSSVVPIALAGATAPVTIVLWMERWGDRPRIVSNVAEISARSGAENSAESAGCASVFLGSVQEILPATHQIQDLPTDYADVTEGRFAPAKRWIKKKLLNNFKQSYVDVLSRQQTQVNRQMVVMIQQLSECCAVLDQAIAGLHRRLDGLESRLEQSAQVDAQDVGRVS